MSDTPLPPPEPRSFINRPPDQVAYVVRDLEPALVYYGKVFGVERWNVREYGPATVPRRMYGGKPADWDSLVATPTYGARLEVVQPIDGPSVYTTFLEERGPGLHHVGYYIPDLAVGRAHFAELGIPEIFSGGGHGVDDDGEFAFFDVVEQFGSYVELITAPARRRPVQRQFVVEGRQWVDL